VIGGMVGFGGLTLHPLFERFGFLHEFGVTFQPYDTITLPLAETLWFPFGFLLILLFKNSNQWAKDFKANKKIAIFTAFVLSFGILSLTKVSEFLYFNF
jgi:hypothetical protein